MIEINLLPQEMRKKESRFKPIDMGEFDIKSPPLVNIAIAAGAILLTLHILLFVVGVYSKSKVVSLSKIYNSMSPENKEAMNLKTNFAGKITKKKSNKRESLYKKIMDMPRVFFPDEYSKNVPSVYLLKEGGLKLEYPSISLSLQKLTCGKMLLSHSGDGKTREFKVLYY